MIQIDANNRIIINGQRTSLAVAQGAGKTRVYTPECRIRGIQYAEHQMPRHRYSLAHPDPASGVPGLRQFEADIAALMAALK